MEYTDYVAIKARIVPGLRYNQEIYEEAVEAQVSGRTAWLDAGCGSHIFQWREQAERTLVGRAGLVVGCDADPASIGKHRTLSRLVVADLEALPFQAETFGLVTTNMVLEHLDRPAAVFAELTRVLKRGGRVIVHTPNVWSPFAVVGRLLPRWVKLKLVKALDGRVEDEVFPTRYRANSPRRLRALMLEAGLQEEWSRLLASEAVFARTHPLLVGPELLYIRLTLSRALRFLRPTVLASFVKPDGLRRATD
jgi:ubiquinone/menaquinone biosynthesis C-methylase UbiE